MALTAEAGGLEQAVEGVPGEDLAVSLDTVLRGLVLAVSAEAALLWLRATDQEEAMHLLSA